MACGFRGRTGQRRPFTQIAGVAVPAIRDEPGVVAGLTGDDRGDLPPPGDDRWPSSCLPPTGVLLVGEPVAMMVTGSRHQGDEAAESANVNYELLSVVANVPVEGRFAIL